MKLLVFSFFCILLVQINGQKYVGILYETWFNQLAKAGWPAVYPTDVPTGGLRCWGYPAVGPYKSDSNSTIENHADLLASAGIDFIIIDYSNNNILDGDLNGPLKPLLEVYMARINAGKKTPKITFLIPTAEDQITKLWNEAYVPYNHDSRLFFEYLGKPLLLPINPCSFQICTEFTIRPTWALRPSNKWSFMELYPQQIFRYDGIPEQTAVSAAQQQTYMSESTAHARNYDYKTNSNNGSEGQNFHDQWQYAIENNVRFVIIKSWNEWCSFKIGNGDFTDEFSPNQSNDLEPVKGYFADLYLKLLTGYIAQFKK